jgi:hypothetical protein
LGDESPDPESSVESEILDENASVAWLPSSRDECGTQGQDPQHLQSGPGVDDTVPSLLNLPGVSRNLSTLGGSVATWSSSPASRSIWLRMFRRADSGTRRSPPPWTSSPSNSAASSPVRACTSTVAEPDLSSTTAHPTGAEAPGRPGSLRRASPAASIDLSHTDSRCTFGLRTRRRGRSYRHVVIDTGMNLRPARIPGRWTLARVLPPSRTALFPLQAEGGWPRSGGTFVVQPQHSAHRYDRRLGRS